MTIEKLKSLRIEYNSDIDMRVKIDLLLLERVGETELMKFWKENNLIGK